jgi:hypothetical protein
MPLDTRCESHAGFVQQRLRHDVRGQIALLYLEHADALEILHVAINRCRPKTRNAVF